MDLNSYPPPWPLPSSPFRSFLGPRQMRRKN
jgi:hypothetical protein